MTTVRYALRGPFAALPATSAALYLVDDEGDLPTSGLRGGTDLAVARDGSGFWMAASSTTWQQIGGGGGGAPSGPAGGVLSGTYPNPGFAADMATQAELTSHADDTTAIHGIPDTSLLLTTAHTDAADPHTQYQKESEKGQANGYASLDANGQVPDAQLMATVARDAEIATAVTVHEADTSDVHGIPDTSVLETTTGAQARVDAHAGDATDAHDASAISVVPAGAIVSTTVQAALEELDSEKAAVGHSHASGNTLLAPGSFTVATGNFAIHGKRLELTGSQRAALEGSARMVLVG